MSYDVHICILPFYFRAWRTTSYENNVQTKLDNNCCNRLLTFYNQFKLAGCINRIAGSYVSHLTAKHADSMFV